MGRTLTTIHACGYQLLREEVIDWVEVGHGLHLPAELRGRLRRDQHQEQIYLNRGSLLYWYDGTLDMEDAELVQRQVKTCPNCGARLPLYLQT